MRVSLVAASAALLLFSTTSHAQDDDAARARARALLSSIHWTNGPVKGQLGEVAEVGVPANCRFTGIEGTKLFMEVTENPVSGHELGTLLCETDDNRWFVLFSYDESGYVKDDEQGTLDRKAILESLQEGTEAGNEERREHGWSEIELTGWQLAPFYDPRTHNLTWSTRLKDKGSDDATINHSVRLLGRGGVMHADLVIDPSELAASLPVFDAMIAEYRYLPGHAYAEWRDGDKIAEYGLTALIAGGAGAAAVKLGFFGKLWKLILGILIALKKAVVLAVVGLIAFLKRKFGGGGDDTPKAPKADKPRKGEARIVEVKRVVAMPQDLPPRSPTASEATLPPPRDFTRSGNSGGSQGPIGPMGT